MADLKVLNKNAFSDEEKLATDHTDKKLFRNVLTPSSVCLPFWASLNFAEFVWDGKKQKVSAGPLCS